jgi:hypothetical protein
MIEAMIRRDEATKQLAQAIPCDPRNGDEDPEPPACPMRILVMASAALLIGWGHVYYVRMLGRLSLADPAR